MASKKRKKTRPPVEKVGGLETRTERKEVFDMLVRTFTNAPPPGMKSHLDKAIWAGPMFDPEHTRICVADGRVVSAIVMAPRVMRFGPVGIPAMTVGPVVTHQDYRRLGYNAVVTHDCERYMNEHGFLLAYLQGLRRYYQQFGYYPYGERGSVTFARNEAERESLPGRLRKMTRKDIPRVSKLYDKATTNYIGTAIRDRKLWDWLIGNGTKSWLFEGPHVILDGRGRLCGYLTLIPRGGIGIREIVVRQDDRSWRAALGAIVARAKKQDVDEIALPLVWGEPMAVFLRQHVQMVYKMTTRPDGGRQLVINDFPALMKALEPLFTQRWRAAGVASRKAQLTLATETGSVCVTAAGGRITVGGPARGTRVRIPRQWLSGLITGYYMVGDIAARKGARIPPSTVPALDILFPGGWPVTFRADNY